MSLEKRKLGALYSLSNELSDFTPSDFLAKIKHETPHLSDLAISQTLLALEHDKLNINMSAVNHWLTTQSNAIQEKCDIIRTENQATTREQSHLRNAAHHTELHHEEVNERSKYLFNQTSISDTNSPNYLADLAISEVFIEAHDLIQSQPFSAAESNETLTQRILLEQLCEKFDIDKETMPDVYHYLCVKSHRLVVLATTVVFDKPLFSLAELYLTTQRLFKLTTPYDTFNEQMLIISLCDLIPACCDELVEMVANSPLGLKNTAIEMLKETNPLFSFLEQDSTQKTYPKEEPVKNLLACLIALSPHAGMCIELSILPPEQKNRIERELNTLLVTEEHSRPLLAFQLPESVFQELSKRKERLSSEEQHYLKKHELSCKLQKHQDALTLRHYLFELKNNAWHQGDAVKPELAFYKAKINHYEDSSVPISDKASELIRVFENVFIKNLAGESIFSSDLFAYALFIANELKGKLSVDPNVCQVDSRIMLQLQTNFYAKTDHQKMIYIHELLFPLVYQLGEFYLANIAQKEKEADASNAHERATSVTDSMVSTLIGHSSSLWLKSPVQHIKKTFAKPAAEGVSIVNIKSHN